VRILIVAGARPNFIKIAPLLTAFEVVGIDSILVHTGQHYDERMNDVFFRDLEIRQPDYNLAVGSGTHAVQTAEIMKGFEPVLMETAPDAVLVVGDVNSTVAAGLVAVKAGVKLIHVEAGLRSFDRTMPEEINRILTDAMSDLLFCSEQSGVRNLRNEGVDKNKIHLVGNVMIDSLERYRHRAAVASHILADLNISPGAYAVLTMHRPANVDDPDVMVRMSWALQRITSRMPVVFPAHPRTRDKLPRSMTRCDALRIVEPMGYLDFLKLTASAAVVLTDSGGLQEETTALGIPCLTLRDNTERPATIDCGTNILVGTDARLIVSTFDAVCQNPPLPVCRPRFWDGCTAERIALILIKNWEKG